MINTQPSAAASTNAKEIPPEERNHLTRMIDIAITEAEQEYRMNGILMDASQTLLSLRNNHFG
ncbi:hypothetical protein [Selenomonas sp. oral taxon 478]|uniref:hypothetical protein n=1 Tax=Selenomonas sp. oral taxon 478 TaxID=712538 RepID=UPI000AF859C2|nr:hypothetical protein [Selenomonas sp. oral taxon 478]